jgi:hypothetical protein
MQHVMMLRGLQWLVTVCQYPNRQYTYKTIYIAIHPKEFLEPLICNPTRTRP